MTDSWNGAAYSNIAELQRALALKSIDELAWDRQSTVIDLGCGDGAIAAAIAERVPEGSVLGLDKSPDQIAFATKTYVLPNLRFNVADATTFEVNPARNILTSFNALHWVDNLEAAIERIRLALFSGGLILLRVAGLGELQSVGQTVAVVCQSPSWASHFEGHKQPHQPQSVQAWSTLLEGDHFDNVALAPENVEWDFRNRDEFAAWLRGVSGPWLQYLQPEQHDAFISDVLDAYCEVVGKQALLRSTHYIITATRT